MEKAVLMFLLLSGGIIWLCIARLMANKKCTERVAAEVVRHRAESDDTSETYRMYYSYEYDGNTYQGNFVSGISLEKELPIGSVIGVYVNPKMPKRSCLRLRGEGSENRFLVVGLWLWIPLEIAGLMMLFAS